MIWMAPGRARPPRRPRRRPESGDSFWAMLWTYAAVAALGLLVLTVVGKPSAGVMPAMARLPARAAGRGGLAAWLGGIRVDRASAHDWLQDGAPLVAWMAGRTPVAWPIHWRSLGSAALSAVTATPLNNLNELMAAAVPELKPIRVDEPPVAVLPPEAFAMDRTLPGAGGRVWAVLGRRPIVGLYQTHSHESFWPVLPKTSPEPYSTHWSDTVVQVGWWLAEDLHAHGVGVVQSRVDNMREGLLASYGLSLQTARTLLRWWPSVQVLLDVQRGDAGRVDTVARIHGRNVARILLVVGTSQLLPNPHWQENLAFAIRLARELTRIAPGILRRHGVETVPYRYNQQLLPADLIVEVGGPQNTLGEERRAVFDLAAALAEVLPARPAPSP